MSIMSRSRSPNRSASRPVRLQRDEPPDGLENDEGRDRDEHDDEDRGFRLQLELREIAIEPARRADARRILVGADVEKHITPVVGTPPTTSEGR
jgi:hypothetical protein